MSLQPGARLGPYEILALVGVGGMGEVYKARDTRLDRTVAVKILPDMLAADPQFRERFDREARTISQLDHPHICALHDVGEQQGTSFLVMQYLEGETLADRLTKGALPIDQAIRTAIEIGSALDRAHRAGIVHRDLKPGNIMLTKSGAKLLDFGLAKTDATGAVVAGVSLMTATSPSLTERGTILGTFQYMAPEQVEGFEADGRTDIFAFGVVLYEMITGQRAFTGNTHASLLSSILKDAPRPIIELQPLTPTLLEHIVSRCLAKDRDDRWQSASDLTRELRWLSESGVSARMSASTLSRAARPARLMRGAGLALVGLLVGVAATMVAERRRGPSGERADVARAMVSVAPAEYLQALPSDRTTTEGRPGRTTMAWSPDGRSMVFSGVRGDRQELYVRSLDHLEATAIPGTEDASEPFFSPDGQWLAFWSAGTMRKIPVSGGGPATTICNTAAMFGASWGSTDIIVFARPGVQGLWQVPAAGGTPQNIAKPDDKAGELKYLLPRMLPGGETVLFTVTHSPLPTWDDTEVVAQSLSTGKRTILVRGGEDGRYLPSGHIVFLRRGTLMAVPFDLKRLEVTGGAVALIDGVMQAANTPSETSESGAGQFAVSETGSLLYVPGGVFPNPERSLVWVDRTGVARQLPLATRAWVSPRISSDGQRITAWTQGDRNVWIFDQTREVLTRLTSDARNARAIWTTDGTRVIYGSATGGNENVFWRAADGSGQAERITTSEFLQAAATASPDGQMLAFVQSHSDTGFDIWRVPLHGDRRPEIIVGTRFAEAYPDFSPDGRWLAYASDESGQSEVYVQPYPDPGARQQVSTAGGTGPAWSRDGRELFYTTTQTVGGQAALTKMMTVPIALRPTFTAGVPHQLFEGMYGASAAIRSYDVAPDGRHFLMVQQKERLRISAAEMILVLHWGDELKARVPSK
jgi:Tol biopolymer transport system component